MKRKKHSESKYKPFYGSYTTVTRHLGFRKVTFVCKVSGCNYSTRSLYYGRGDRKQNIEFNSSYNCPVHGNTLVNIGMANELPKVGKKRDKLISHIQQKYNK